MSRYYLLSGLSRIFRKPFANVYISRKVPFAQTSQIYACGPRLYKTFHGFLHDSHIWKQDFEPLKSLLSSLCACQEGFYKIRTQTLKNPTAAKTNRRIHRLPVSNPNSASTQSACQHQQNRVKTWGNKALCRFLWNWLVRGSWEITVGFGRCMLCHASRALLTFATRSTTQPGAVIASRAFNNAETFSPWF